MGVRSAPLPLLAQEDPEHEVMLSCHPRRVMLAGPKGRAVGESGELDREVRKGQGKVGVLSDATLLLLAQKDP
eukprot:6060061-Pyramimonas_sp.AAC.2